MGKNLANLSYHIIVVLLSAAIALSMPVAVNALAESLLRAWAYIADEKIFLVALEIFTAVLLIFFFNILRQVWKYRKIAAIAKSAGLVLASTYRGKFEQRKIRRIKGHSGFARELMIIGSTGYHTFIEPAGDLHDAVCNCREAKIMLLNPFTEGAITRAQSIADPEITPAVLREQVNKSIDFLKKLRERQKQLQLKLYPDLPILKLAIVGDYAFLRHYHTGQNIRHMPEYAFKNEQNHGGLYIPLYRYFLSRWHDPVIPEYDFETGELIYHDRTGNELHREEYGITTSGANSLPTA